MVSPQDLEKIDRLRQNLYSKKHPPLVTDGRAPISQSEYEVPQDWIHPDPVPPNAPPSRKAGSFFRKVLIISLLFFIVSSALALFVFFGGFNIISSNNVEIDVAGPVSVGGGAELPLEIVVKNKNNSDLEYANLMIEYPTGTRSATDINTELPRDRVELGTIPAGKSARTLVKSLLFGEEHSTKDIKIVVEYKVKNSNGSFFKEKDYSLTLSSAPVTVTVNTLKEVSAGQEFTTTVDVASNSNTVLSNLLLSAEYPFGFNFTGGTPAPSYDNSIWTIGELKPGEKKTISIKGKIEGQDGEDRTVRLVVGTQSPDDEKLIKTPFVTDLETIALKKPFIGLALDFNGQDSKEYVVNGTNRIGGTISWQNNLPSQIVDGVIQVQIDGSIIDESTIAPGSGYYRSIDNTIIWDKRSIPDLAAIDAGKSGSMSFSFAPRKDAQSLRNPQLSFTVSAEAKRVSETKVPETLTASITNKVKVATKLAVDSDTLYSVGPFVNTGPIPAKANEPTSYTIRWRISNTANNISNTEVRATLPPYVTWMGAATTTGEKIQYIPERNEIVWSPGQVVSGTGISSPAREVYFQVRLLPSINQVGSKVRLLGTTEATAHDIFTNTDIKDDDEDTDTKISADDTKYATTIEKIQQ